MAESPAPDDWDVFLASVRRQLDECPCAAVGFCESWGCQTVRRLLAAYDRARPLAPHEGHRLRAENERLRAAFGAPTKEDGRG